MYGEKLFRCPKTILGREQRFFVLVLSKMDLGNVDTWKMQVFIWITVKYVMESYWYPPLAYLRKVYCEIYIE